MDSGNRYLTSPRVSEVPARFALKRRVIARPSADRPGLSKRSIAVLRLHEPDRLTAAALRFPTHNPPTAEELEFHARLFERLAQLHQERSSIWGKVRRWFGLSKSR